MQTNYKRKYLILGPWPRNRKLVRDVIKENTDLKVGQESSDLFNWHIPEWR